jgi:hypothetical protein
MGKLLHRMGEQRQRLAQHLQRLQTRIDDQQATDSVT